VARKDLQYGIACDLNYNSVYNEDLWGNCPIALEKSYSAHSVPKLHQIGDALALDIDPFVI